MRPDLTPCVAHRGGAAPVIEAEGVCGPGRSVDRGRHRMPTRRDSESRSRRTMRWLDQLGGEHRRIGPKLARDRRRSECRLVSVSRILRRHGVSRPAVCDPMTGEVIRASKTTAVRYERELARASCVHTDVKKSSRHGSPTAVAGRAHGREMRHTWARKKARLGYGLRALRRSTITSRFADLGDPRRRARCDHRWRSSTLADRFRRTWHPRRPRSTDRQRLELHPQQRDDRSCWPARKRNTS